MIVVFDSNVWISELGLRSPAAAAVKFFLTAFLVRRLLLRVEQVN
jgi:hypothetical protein